MNQLCFALIRMHLEVKEDEWLSIELLVDHASKDTHHGSTALVEFLGTELELFLLALVTQETNRDHGATKVARERALSLLPQTNFQHTNETNNLSNTSSRDARDGRETGRDVREFRSRQVNVSREADSSPGGLAYTNITTKL